MKFSYTCLMLLISGCALMAHNDDYDGAGVLVRPLPSSKNTSIFATSYDKEHLLKTVPQFVNVHKGDYYAYAHPEFSNKFRQMAKSRAKEEKPANIYRVNHMLNSLRLMPANETTTNANRSVSTNASDSESGSGSPVLVPREENANNSANFKTFYGIGSDPNDMFTKLDSFNKPKQTYKANRNGYDPQRLVNKLNAEERTDATDPSVMFALLNKLNNNEEPLATVEKKEDKNWERLLGKKYAYLTRQEDNDDDSYDRETKTLKMLKEYKDEKESTQDNDCVEETTISYKKPNKSKDDEEHECEEEEKPKTAKGKQNEHELDAEEEHTTEMMCENETPKSKTDNDMTDNECDEETNVPESKELEEHTTEMVCDEEITTTKRSRIEDEEIDEEIECDEKTTKATPKDHKDADKCDAKTTATTGKTTLEKTTATTATKTKTKTTPSTKAKPCQKSHGFSLARLMPFGLKAHKQNNNNNSDNNHHNNNNKSAQSELNFKKKKKKMTKHEQIKDANKSTKLKESNKHAMAKKKKKKHKSTDDDDDDEFYDQMALNNVMDLKNLCREQTNVCLKGEKLQRTCTENDFNEQTIMTDPVASLLHSWSIKVACDKGHTAQPTFGCPKPQVTKGKVKQCKFNQTTCDRTLTLLRAFKRNAVHVLLNANDLETRLKARMRETTNLLRVVQGQCALEQSNPSKA